MPWRQHGPPRQRGSHSFYYGVVSASTAATSVGSWTWIWAQAGAHAWAEAETESGDGDGGAGGDKQGGVQAVQAVGADICGDKLCGIRDHNVLEQLPGEFTSLHCYLLRQIRFPDFQRQSSSRSLFYHVSFLSLSQYYILVALSCNVIMLVNGLVWICFILFYLFEFFWWENRVSK